MRCINCANCRLKRGRSHTAKCWLQTGNYCIEIAFLCLSQGVLLLFKSGCGIESMARKTTKFFCDTRPLRESFTHNPFYLSLWPLSMFCSFRDGWVSMYMSFLPLHCTSFKAEINPTYFCPFFNALFHQRKMSPSPLQSILPTAARIFFSKT